MIKRTLRIIVAALGFLAICGLAGYISYLYGVTREIPQPTVREQVIALQIRVGAEPDGIVGPETTTKTNAAVKAEEKELFNGYASVFMTADGRPRK